MISPNYTVGLIKDSTPHKSLPLACFLDCLSYSINPTLPGTVHHFKYCIHMPVKPWRAFIPMNVILLGVDDALHLPENSLERLRSLMCRPAVLIQADSDLCT